MGGIFSDLRAFFVPGSNPIGRGGLIAPPIRENASSRALRTDRGKKRLAFIPGDTENCTTIPELLRSEVESHESLIVREKDQTKSLKAYSLAFGRVGRKDSHR